MKSILAFVLTLSASLSFASLKKITLTSSAKIAIFPPLLFVEENQLKGSLTEQIKCAFKQNNYQTEFQLLPWKRSQLYFKEKRVHGFLPAFASLERDKAGTFIPLLNDRIVWLSAQFSNIKFNQFGLPPKNTVIGVMRGGWAQNYLKKQGFKNFIEADGYEKLAQIFQAKRTDLLLVSEFILEKFDFTVPHQYRETVFREQDIGLYIQKDLFFNQKTLKSFFQSVENCRPRRSNQSQEKDDSKSG